MLPLPQGVHGQDRHDLRIKPYPDAPFLLQAVFLISSSKKGISSNHLYRTLDITLKSAWFMSRRIREAMRAGDLVPFGGKGGAVEVDEIFIDRDFNKKPKGEKKGRGYDHKNKVLFLVDRATGQARSVVVDNLKTSTLMPILHINIAREARVMADEADQYKHVDKHFAEHAYTRHAQCEYVSKADPTIHTKTIEGYLSIFKRGMKGAYQYYAHNHLHRYLSGFDFRYNNCVALGVDDEQRANVLLRSVVGKRLTYERAN